MRRLYPLLLALLATSAACNLKNFFGDTRCYTTADCLGDKVCSANLCIEPGTLGTGRKCWATRDCQSGQTCQLVPESDNGQQTYSEHCLPAGSGTVGQDCNTSLDCTAGLVCELVAFSGECQSGGSKDRGDACTSTADCLAGLACGPNLSCQSYTEAYPIFGGVVCPAETGAFRAHFEVPRPGKTLADFFRLPFPSDVRVDASGQLDMSDFPRPGPTPLGVDLVGLFVDALVADFDGYSAIAPITFRYSAPVDATTLATAATWVDVTMGDSFGVTQPSLATSHPEQTKYSCSDRVVVEHAVGDVLLPRHTYAVILRGVASTTAQQATQDPDLAAVLAPTRPAGDAPLGTAWDQHAGLRMWLSSQNIAASTVQGVALFTVSDSTSAISKMHDLVAAAPAPVLTDLTLCADGVKSPCDDGVDRICGAADPTYDEIQGRITIPIFQQGTEPYLHPADGGGINLAAPQIVRTEEVCFGMTIPKTQTAPTAGWPLVVYHHGTGGSFRSFVTEGIGPAMATNTTPFAVISFDAVEHGSRKNGSLIDSKDLVFNVLNPRAARDNALQGGADVMQMLRTGGLTIPPTPGVNTTAITFDPDHVVYFGHSQGGNSGHLGLAYTSTTHVAVLSGSGGGLVDGILTKTNPVNIADGMKYLIGEPIDATHPAMLVFQNFFDRSDPLVYSPLLIRRTPMGVPSKHVFQTYGLGDTYAPSKTLANINEGLGIPLVNPILEAVVDPVSPTLPAIDRPVIGNLIGSDGTEITAATFQYDPMGAYDGHFVSTQDAQAITDWKFFFTSFLLAGTPHVP